MTDPEHEQTQTQTADASAPRTTPDLEPGTEVYRIRAISGGADRPLHVSRACPSLKYVDRDRVHIYHAPALPPETSWCMKCAQPVLGCPAAGCDETFEKYATWLSHQRTHCDSTDRPDAASIRKAARDGTLNIEEVFDNGN